MSNEENDIISPTNSASDSALMNIKRKVDDLDRLFDTMQGMFVLSKDEESIDEISYSKSSEELLRRQLSDVEKKFMYGEPDNVEIVMTNSMNSVGDNIHGTSLLETKNSKDLNSTNKIEETFEAPIHLERTRVMYRNKIFFILLFVLSTTGVAFISIVKPSKGTMQTTKNLTMIPSKLTEPTFIRPILQHPSNSPTIISNTSTATATGNSPLKSALKMASNRILESSRHGIASTLLLESRDPFNSLLQHICGLSLSDWKKEASEEDCDLCSCTNFFL